MSAAIEEFLAKHDICTVSELVGCRVLKMTMGYDRSMLFTAPDEFAKELVGNSFEITEFIKACLDVLRIPSEVVYVSDRTGLFHDTFIIVLSADMAYIININEDQISLTGPYSDLREVNVGYRNTLSCNIAARALDFRLCLVPFSAMPENITMAQYLKLLSQNVVKM